MAFTTTLLHCKVHKLRGRPTDLSCSCTLNIKNSAWHTEVLNKHLMNTIKWSVFIKAMFNSIKENTHTHTHQGIYRDHLQAELWMFILLDSLYFLWCAYHASVLSLNKIHVKLATLYTVFEIKRHKSQLHTLLYSFLFSGPFHTESQEGSNSTPASPSWNLFFLISNLFHISPYFSNYASEQLQILRYHLFPHQDLAVLPPKSFKFFRFLTSPL